MNLTHKLIVHLDDDRPSQPVPVVQGDTARSVEVALYAEGQAWIVPADAAISIRYRRSDGAGDQYDTLPDGAQAWSIDGNSVTVALAPAVLGVPGTTTLQIAVQRGEAVLSTFSFPVQVQADPSVGASAPEDPPQSGGTTVELQPLTFTGAVETTYDGKTPVTVDIPEGGAGGVLTVNLVPEGEHGSLDRTFSELRAAIDAGQMVVCKMEDTVYPLYKDYGDSLCFGSLIEYSEVMIWVQSDNTVDWGAVDPFLDMVGGLPVAAADTLGGVMPVAKTEDMTQSVGVDENGGLWTDGGLRLYEASITTEAAVNGLTLSFPVAMSKFVRVELHLTFGTVENAFTVYSRQGTSNYKNHTSVSAGDNKQIHVSCLKMNEGVLWTTGGKYLWCSASNGGPTNVSGTMLANLDTITFYSATEGVDFPAGTTFSVWGVYEP